MMKLPLDLPKPSFRKVDDELSRKPSTPEAFLLMAILRPFDANLYDVDQAGEGFHRPDYYIRHIGMRSDIAEGHF
jgi:hypothetical protein